MKLRLRGSSLRLRLGQAEVASLVDHGRIEERVAFGPGAALVYALASDDNAKDVHARLDGSRIEVIAPRSLIKSWAAGDEVGFEASQAIAGGDALRILVEKDFACLKTRAGEDDADAFPNPRA